VTAVPKWPHEEYAEDIHEDGPGVLDYFLAVTLGVATIVLLSVWSYPFLHPSAWADTAVGAGLRPPQHVFPGSARLCASLAYLCLPPKIALFSLSILARIIAGASVAFTYLLFSDILHILLRTFRRNKIWDGRIKRYILVTGTGLFAYTDALWKSGQTLTADTFLMFGTILLLWLFFRFLCSGRLSIFYCCVFLSGLLCAESPSGLIWAIFLAVASLVALRALDNFNLPFFDPLVMQFSKWRMSFFIFQGFALGITLNLASFFILDGWKASGWDVADLIIKSIVHYGLVAAGAATILGWILSLVFALIPLIVAVVLFRGATDEDNFLPYRSGIAYVVLGVMSLSQLCALKPFWFWTWTDKGELISSVYLRGLCALASSLTMLLSLTVLGVAVYVRNNHRIMRQRFPEFLESAAEVARIAAQRRAVRFVRRFGASFMLVLLLACVVPGRRQATLRAVLGELRDFVRETVAEAGKAEWLFTDGQFDDAVELCAAEEKRSLKTISMRSEQNPYDTFIRTRGVAREDEENMRVLENGTMDAIRTWVCDRPEGAVNFATQIGPEFWKRANRPLPPAAGVLLRPGMTAEEAKKGTENARGIAERLLALREEGIERMFADSRVVELADAAQWRIAWLVRIRAEGLDRTGRPQDANEEMKLAERLNKSNTSLTRLLEVINKKTRESGPQLTPREGLRLALNRADFSLAARYAIPILNGDPADAEANFGMGMNFLLEKQYSRAAECLRRVLDRKPKEPAALNNLAVCLVNLHDFDGAEACAKRALQLMPASSEIKETLEMIAKARSDAAKAKKIDDAEPKPKAEVEKEKEK